jgi:hypothetical protein
MSCGDRPRRFFAAPAAAAIRVSATLAADGPGVLPCVVIALAVRFLSGRYGGPRWLFALRVGLAFNFLRSHPQVALGIQFCDRTVLRCGMALMGALAPLLRDTAPEASGCASVTYLNSIGVNGRPSLQLFATGGSGRRGRFGALGQIRRASRRFQCLPNLDWVLGTQAFGQRA